MGRKKHYWWLLITKIQLKYIILFIFDGKPIFFFTRYFRKYPRLEFFNQKWESGAQCLKSNILKYKGPCLRTKTVNRQKVQMNFNAIYQQHVSEPSKSNWTHWYKKPSMPKWLEGSLFNQCLALRARPDQNPENKEIHTPDICLFL